MTGKGKAESVQVREEKPIEGQCFDIDFEPRLYFMNSNESEGPLVRVMGIKCLNRSESSGRVAFLHKTDTRVTASQSFPFFFKTT